LLVEGKKMSKSLGNFFTLRDLLAKGFSGREIRYLLITAHYRETFNFTLDGLNGAKTALARIDECVSKLRELAGENTGQAQENDTLISNFSSALEDDLNISRAWAAVFEWIRETNLWYNSQLHDETFEARVTRAKVAANKLAAWEKVDSVLGIGVKIETEIPIEILEFANARAEAKKLRDFKKSDAIRDELKAKGWVIEDTPKGIKLKKL
jgi:cysteinyl-tRNA synthetase